jgi:hypothetical protein
VPYDSAPVLPVPLDGALLRRWLTAPAIVLPASSYVYLVRFA